MSLLVAATMRTLTLIVSVLPRRSNSRSCRTRSSFTCVDRLMSPISSRNSVPPSASSKRPFLRCSELAEGGTLFLDEIGDINLSTQVKLLRVLQEREFERLGGTDSVKVNVRLIAATNKDMEKALVDGTFREDLYYRLNVFTIFVPPLRERKADLLLLADHFLEKFSREHGKVIKRISTPAIDMLTAYHWPGNVRELENALERGVLVCDGQVIHGHHLPPSLQTADSSGTVTRVSLKDAVAAYERDLILDALKTTRGNRAKAARLLDTTERILNYKVQGYGIDVRRFKSSEVGRRQASDMPSEAAGEFVR